MAETGSYSLSGMAAVGAACGRRAEFVTVAASTLVLVVLCALFRALGACLWRAVGSLPFAAILAIVGLGQMLVVQQGGFDLSVPGGVSLAVVIATHYPRRRRRCFCRRRLPWPWSARWLRGWSNGILVGIVRLNAIIATIGMNALLYGGVFAVSGGVPRITTQLLAAIAGGEVFGIADIPSLIAVAMLALVCFVHEEDRGRAAVRGDRRQSARRPRHGLPVVRSSGDGLCSGPAALLHRRPPDRRHHARAHRLSGRPCCCPRWPWWCWAGHRLLGGRGFPVSTVHRRLLPEPTQPVRARGRGALFGPDHHPGFGAGFWHRGLLAAVDGDLRHSSTSSREEKDEISRSERPLLP